MATKNKSAYVPSFLKAALQDARPVQLTFSDIVDTNILSTSSFRYDTLDKPLKSTQQVNVDWSLFENHTFFSSAEVNVNTAFDQIINGFPFDGTKIEMEQFFEKISGFEKWVFDQLPKFSGQLLFSGTQVGEDPSNGFAEALGTWIRVVDIAGSLYPDLSKNKSGQIVIGPPADKSFTVEMQVFIPDQVNDVQVILQKVNSSKDQGFCLFLEQSTNSYATGTFSVFSGSIYNSVSSVFEKGRFNHLCVSINRENGDNTLDFYVNEALAAQSRKKKLFGEFTEKSDLLIGSGSSFYTDPTSLVAPAQTFSGSMDELRIFHAYRSIGQQKSYATKGLFANETLKLYYRFNEPSGSLSDSSSDQVNSIVLDSSGNSLHALINNFTTTLRQSASDDYSNPVKNERPEFKVVLFPMHEGVVELNTRLLTSASIYDQANPNLITKLIPRHYLREGGLFEGFENTSVEGSIGDPYGGNSMPGQVRLGSVQLMLTFLYIWAKFFDDMKMFVDALQTLNTVEYTLNETVPDNFVMDLVRLTGFYLPPFFSASSISQYIDGEDIEGVSTSDVNLKYVQTQLLRRVLVVMPDILRSKGTQHSIKSFLRSVGIDPDNNMRIREFGGPTTKQLGASREVRSEFVPVLDFTTGSMLTTPFLSASRIEPGYPEPEGTFVDGLSTSVNDGLLTSGSWTFEGLYKYGEINSRRPAGLQSLARFEVTGSSSGAQIGLVANIISSGSGLHAFVRPGMGTSSPVLHLYLNDAEIQNGERWNVSFGCRRNDSIDSTVSSSYFLRAANQNSGEIVESYTTSSYFYEQPSGEGNVFREVSATLNASGSRISIGTDPNIPEGPGYYFLNDTVNVDDSARAYEFTGQASNVRFWSKYISEDEWREHVRNFRSVGVDNAAVNYNYVSNLTGSFERLRLNILEKQSNRSTDGSGALTILDMSENGFHATASGFDTYKNIFINDIIYYSYLSPYFDEYSSTEKVRIRGFLDGKYTVDSPWSSVGPVQEIDPSEMPMDDPRFSIEFSLIDSLNKDMVTMFSSLKELGNAIGSPELMFSPNYPDLEWLREVYFNRIKDSLNFRGFFEFYRWFDQSISTFIQQLVPRKTRFKGTNFVVESHMFERAKVEYQSSEIYMGDATRARIRDVILLQQIVGKIKKF